jgi:hypothetical protein
MIACDKSHLVVGSWWLATGDQLPAASYQRLEIGVILALALDILWLIR